MKLHPIACPGGELILSDSGSPGLIVATMNPARPNAREECVTIAAATLACHGLPIPPNVPPGALAALVDAARRVAHHWEDLRSLPPGEDLSALAAALAPFTTDPAPPVSPAALIPFGDGTWYRCDRPELFDTLESLGFRRVAGYVEANVMSGIPAKAVAAGLVRFPEEPERKPYGYAVKANAKGYLAIQGNQAWFESEPVGWAIFGTEDHARVMLEGNHSMIGTAPHEGGEVVPVYRD